MNSELVQLSFDKIMQTHTYTVIVLKNGETKFAIYVEPQVGKVLQMYLTDIEKPRPLTHDFISSLCKGFEIQVKQVVIVDVEDTVYYARIFLEQMRGDIRHIVEIDGRPSDFITLALMHNAPVWCVKELLDKVIPVVE
ncbi:MAG: bifunctional nuclease family protein [Verrucomicrobia bacterium]|nr:bifunctional nuclease family protein [Verrucomicrobiota bacterium]MBS0636320.1 bifunctional nuclease family protein [Verrucomicrobiota bacterium]